MSVGGPTPPSTPLASCRGRRGDSPAPSTSRSHTPPSTPPHWPTPTVDASATTFQRRTFGVNVTNAPSTPSAALDKSLAAHAGVGTPRTSPPLCTAGTPPAGCTPVAGGTCSMWDRRRASRGYSTSTASKRSRSGSPEAAPRVMKPDAASEDIMVDVQDAVPEVDFATDPADRWWGQHQGNACGLAYEGEQHFPAAWAAQPSFKIVAAAQRYARECVLFAADAAKKTSTAAHDVDALDIGSDAARRLVDDDTNCLWQSCDVASMLDGMVDAAETCGVAAAAASQEGSGGSGGGT